MDRCQWGEVGPDAVAAFFEGCAAAPVDALAFRQGGHRQEKVEIEMALFWYVLYYSGDRVGDRIVEDQGSAQAILFSRMI